jgi:hypothetical protein
VGIICGWTRHRRSSEAALAIACAERSYVFTVLESLFAVLGGRAGGTSAMGARGEGQGLKGGAGPMGARGGPLPLPASFQGGRGGGGGPQGLGFGRWLLLAD